MYQIVNPYTVMNSSSSDCFMPRALSSWIESWHGTKESGSLDLFRELTSCQNQQDESLFGSDTFLCLLMLMICPVSIDWSSRSGHTTDLGRQQSPRDPIAARSGSSRRASREISFPSDDRRQRLCQQLFLDRFSDEAQI